MKQETIELILHKCKGIIRNFYKQLQANKSNHKKIDKFLQTYYLLSLNLEEIERLNKLINSKEIGPANKIFPTKLHPGPCGFTGELFQTFKGELIPILSTFSKKYKWWEHSRTSFPRPSLP